VRLFYIIPVLFNLIVVRPDCNSIKNGEFEIFHSDVNGIMTTTSIERNDSTQIETNYQSGVKLKFSVKWLDECTYQLFWVETISDKYELQYPEDMILTVEILDITDEYYLQKSSSNLYDEEFEGKVFFKK